MRENEIVRIIVYFTIEKYKGVADAISLIQVYILGLPANLGLSTTQSTT